MGLIRDFEVIVVGAGPAGSMIAKELSQKKFKVLLLEKELEVGYPNKSTAATPLETFTTFDLPKSLAYSDVYGMRIFGPSEVGNLVADKVLGRVFRFRELKQYLVKEAIGLGCVVYPGAEVTDFIRKDQNIVGVEFKGYSFKGRAFANVVVDASGPNGFLSTKLGLWQKDKNKLGVAFEYFLKGAKPDKHKNGYFLDILMGSSVAPGGYAWIFPTSEDEVKAGICKLKPDFKVNEELSQVEYFHKLWQKNPQIKGSQPFEIHDCAHYITGGEKRGVLDNFLAIGDAVNKVNPLWGEGVRASFYSARFAAEAIENARKRNDYSQKVLKMYDETWRKKWGLNWTFAKILFEILYSADDRALDSIIKAASGFDPYTLYNLYIGKVGKSDYLKFLKSIVKVVNPRLLLSLGRLFF